MSAPETSTGKHVFALVDIVDVIPKRAPNSTSSFFHVAAAGKFGWGMQAQASGKATVDVKGETAPLMLKYQDLEVKIDPKLLLNLQIPLLKGSQGVYGEKPKFGGEEGYECTCKSPSALPKPPPRAPRPQVVRVKFHAP